MIKRSNHLFKLLKKELGLILSISLGVFLFVLFFQPFALDALDFDDRLIFIAGLGAIVFLFMFLIRIVILRMLQNYESGEIKIILPSIMSSFIILILCSVAFPFYLHYVGQVDITFYIMFKVVSICLVPAIVLGIYDAFISLKLQNESLIVERKIIEKQVEKYEEDYLNKSIDFVSENSTETLNLLIADVAYIKSADNYVEIAFKENLSIKKKLIRNTLKNIEQIIRPYSNFIRCHRTCIVNIHYIKKLNSNNGNHWLTINEYEEHIPVSRQYLLKLKEAL